MKRAAIGVAVVALLLSACRTAAPPPAIPVSPEEAGAAALLEALAAQARERHALRGVARLALEGPGGSGRSRQVLVLERPSRLRVEILGFLSQTLAVLVTDGERFEFVNAQDRRRETGRVYPTLLWELTGLPLLPEEAVDLMLGAPMPPPGARVVGAARLAGGGVRIDLGPRPGELRQRLEFDADAHLRRMERHWPEGARSWEATFDDYRPVGGTAFAHVVAIHFSAEETRAELRFGEVELNPVLPERIFALEPPTAAAPGRKERG